MSPSETKTKSVGEYVGPLSEDEKQLLLKQEQTNFKVYKYGFIISCCLFFLVIPIVIGIAFYIGWQREKTRLAQFQNQNMAIYKVTGKLLTKDVGGSSMGMHAPLYTVSINDFLLPSVITAFDFKAIHDLQDQNVIAEYIPSVSKNRLIYDLQGNGYNFITQTSIHP